MLYRTRSDRLNLCSRESAIAPQIQQFIRCNTLVTIAHRSVTCFAMALDHQTAASPTNSATYPVKRCKAREVGAAQFPPFVSGRIRGRSCLPERPACRGVAFESIVAPRFLLPMVVVSSNSNSVRLVFHRAGHPNELACRNRTCAQGPSLIEADPTVQVRLLASARATAEGAESGGQSQGVTPRKPFPAYHRIE